MINRASLVSLTILLTACAGPEGEAPSIGSRPIEGILDAPIRGIAPVQSTSSAALSAEIDALIHQAEAGHSGFAANYPAAQNAITSAAGSAIESEAWIAAQLAISALDSARSETVRALGSLDAILAEQAVSSAPAETEKLVDARVHVARLYDDQNTRYDALNANLRTQ